MSTLLVSVSSDDFGDAKKVADDIAREVERAFDLRTMIEGAWPWYRVYSTKDAPAGAVSYAKELLAQEKANKAHLARVREAHEAERTERKRGTRARVRPYKKRDV